MQEQEQQEKIEDWREDISEPAETLKIADKETAIFTFQNEGEKRTHPDYGTSIVFQVAPLNEESTKYWYVNSRNFDLLGQIKELGNLTGLKVKVTRKGSKKSDTRYIIEKV